MRKHVLSSQCTTCSVASHLFPPSPPPLVMYEHHNTERVPFGSSSALITLPVCVFPMKWLLFAVNLVLDIIGIPDPQTTEIGIYHRPKKDTAAVGLRAHHLIIFRLLSLVIIMYLIVTCKSSYPGRKETDRQACDREDTSTSLTRERSERDSERWIVTWCMGV